MGRKINLSGISPTKRSRFGPNSVYVDKSRGENVQVMLGAIGPFWAKWGLGRVPPSASFLCIVNQTPFQELRSCRFPLNLVKKRISVFRRGIRKVTFENFHFRGHLSPKSEIENRSNRHLTQSRLQVTGCTADKYCCSPRAREFPRLVNFPLWRTVAELRGVKVAQFSDFGLFSPYKSKTLKTYLPVISLQPRGYIAEWFRFFHVNDVIVEGPKGWLPAPEISRGFW